MRITQSFARNLAIAAERQRLFAALELDQKALPANPKRSTSSITKREKGIWQRRFWEHHIRDETDLAHHIQYVHHNPVKHGLAQDPKDWPYSSY